MQNKLWNGTKELLQRRGFITQDSLYDRYFGIIHNKVWLIPIGAMKDYMECCKNQLLFE